jgi:hypothetical protein
MSDQDRYQRINNLVDYLVRNFGLTEMQALHCMNYIFSYLLDSVGDDVRALEKVSETRLEME